MRRGHKRTQSATLNFTHAQSLVELPPQAQVRPPPLEIPALLTKSSAKIKEKVCQVESLHVTLADFIDPLFTFGKGFMAKKSDNAKKPQKKQELIAIPQKAEEIQHKTKGFEKKAGWAECKPSKETQEGLMTTKGIRMPFNEKTNKPLKENLSPPMKRELEKPKKVIHSVVQLDSKPTPKPRGHVKHASNLK